MNEPKVIDLDLVKQEYSKNLNESKSDVISFWIHSLASSFRDNESPIRLKGNKDELASFVRAFGMEKRFLVDAGRYGIDHPTTKKTKAALQSSVDEFTTKTKIPWPFRD